MTKKRYLSKDTNYYEILLNLREIEYKLLAVNQQPTSSWDIDILLLKAKTIIFGNEELKAEFKRRQTSFYENSKTAKYQKRADKAYNLIKELAINKAKKKQRNLTYFEAFQKENFYSPANSKVEKGNNFKKFSDQPNEYYYPSLQSDKIVLSGIFPSPDDYKGMQIAINLESFYNTLFPDISKIRIYDDFVQPKTVKEMLKKQDEIGASMQLCPTDLEFYIASADIKCGALLEAFHLFFYATSICYVLRELQMYTQNLIYKTEYTKSGVPKLPQERYKLTYDKETNTFYINNTIFKLSDTEKLVLKEWGGFEDCKNEIGRINLSDYKRKINNKAQTQFHINIIQRIGTCRYGLENHIII